MSDRDREQGEVQEQLDDRQTKQMEDKQDTKQKEEKSNTKTDEGKTKQKTEDEKPKQNSQTNEKQDVKADQADDEAYLGPSQEQEIVHHDSKDKDESKNNDTQTNNRQNAQNNEHDRKEEEGVEELGDEGNNENKIDDQKEVIITVKKESIKSFDSNESERNVQTENEITNESSNKESEPKSDPETLTPIKTDNNTKHDKIQDNDNIENDSPSNTSEKTNDKDEAYNSTSSAIDFDKTNAGKINSDDTFITQISKTEQTNRVSSPSHMNSEEQIQNEKENKDFSAENDSEEKSTPLHSDQSQNVHQDENTTNYQKSKIEIESYGSTQEKDGNGAELTEEVNQKESLPEIVTKHKDEASDVNDSECESNDFEDRRNQKDKENKNYFYISTPLRSETNEESDKTKTSDEEIRDRTRSHSEKPIDENERDETHLKKDTSKQAELESEYLDDEFDSASETSSKRVNKTTANKEDTQEPTKSRSHSRENVNQPKEKQSSTTEEHSNETSPGDTHKNVDFDNRKQSNNNQKSSQQIPSERSNTQSPRRIVAEEKKQKRQTAQSADYRRLTNRGTPRRSYHAQTRPKTTGQRSVRSVNYSIGSEAGGRKQKEFFREELKRLQNSLQQEKSKIHKPKERDYYPYTFTSLEPYYNTYVASYLIELNDEQPHGFITRNTAQGLCDPWIALRMDKEILPKLETSSKNPSTASSSKSHKKQGKEKNRPPKEGSTRLPKFPVVNFNAGKENATKQFPYSEIPQFREEMRSKFSPHAQNKVDSDYNRTKQDFYRMELDKIDEIHPLNRPHMRKAYFAYLQNTPGSRKAIKECAKSLPPCK